MEVEEKHCALTGFKCIVDGHFSSVCTQSNNSLVALGILDELPTQLVKCYIPALVGLEQFTTHSGHTAVAICPFLSWVYNNYTYTESGLL